MGIMLLPPLLTADEEIALARAIEAGIVAAAILGGEAAGADISAGYVPPGTPPTADELAALVKLGREAEHRMLECNLRLVKLVSFRTARRTGVNEEDLFQEGCLGLADAVVRYDHRRGARFATFAVPWIRCRISDAVIAAPSIRVSAHRIGQHRAERDQPAGAGRPTRVSDWGRVSASRVLAGVVPLDQGSLELVDPTADPSVEAAATVRLPWSHLLAGLPQRQRQVIELRFGFVGPARSAVETAAELGVSDTTIRRLERRGLAALRRSVIRLGLDVGDLLSAA